MTRHARRNHMSIVRLSVIWVGALLSIAPAMANPAAGPGAEVAPPPPNRGAVAGGGQMHRGAGGVGLAPPHREDQIAAIKLLLQVDDDTWQAIAPKVESVIAAKQNMSTGAGMNWHASNNAKPTYQA